ncbi:MAG TPA: protein-L-isoaspartate(D-aspartate) O-methyltransferase [Caulobacter sp.]|nr:protein-L-isoaspartate(D-aspartate) O-methyltransferase [Caulobacter sp.]
MLDMLHARARMVDQQLAARGISDPFVLDAMRQVPREAFLPDAMAEFAYEDSALPLGEGQTVSQPWIVAAMIQAAEVRPGDRVLEIGAGSGYAAAVLSRIAAGVFAIERIETLSLAAKARLQRLGYDNVEVRTGDGSHGLPQAAPFDAILVAASGPAIPQPLKEQLDIGGRLVAPVGESPEDQRLVKITRVDAGHFVEEDLGGVRFVPLIGAHGWADAQGRRPAEARSFAEPSIPQLIRQAAEPLPDPDNPAFAVPFDRFAASKVVLLGECSHGTSEFYRARAAITRRLVERHGFRIIALEADWPDAAALNRRVRGQPQVRTEDPPFSRFPTWMWRNAEFEAFLGWMTEWNAGRQDQAGIHGLDLYNLSGSIEAVLRYLDEVDREAAAVARERYGCLSPWAKEPQAYGRMALSQGYARCEAAVARMLSDLVAKQVEYAAGDGDQFLDAEGAARLVKNAEAYYRAMYYGSAESWNLRDSHMFETLEALLDHGGPDARAVVWAHNSHIGDASKTEMGLDREEHNIGQLCRQRFGGDAALIGFGAHSGTVACASDWDGPMEVKRVSPSRPDSYERLAHDSGVGRFLLDLREGVNPEVRWRLLEPRLERFIGVIYRPETERWSHYSACSLPQQFDAYVWFDETRAVEARPTTVRPGEDDTWPFGL